MLFQCSAPRGIHNGENQLVAKTTASHKLLQRSLINAQTLIDRTSRSAKLNVTNGPGFQYQYEGMTETQFVPLFFWRLICSSEVSSSWVTSAPDVSKPKNSKQSVLVIGSNWATCLSSVLEWTPNFNLDSLQALS